MHLSSPHSCHMSRPNISSDLTTWIQCGEAHKSGSSPLCHLLQSPVAPSLLGPNKVCPNKSARFKVRAIVVLLSWRHWKFNICHLALLRLVVMERYTKERCVIIVKTHYKYEESYAETIRKLRGIFGRRNAPYQSTVKRLINKFQETGSIMDSKLS